MNWNKITKYLLPLFLLLGTAYITIRLAFVLLPMVFAYLMSLPLSKLVEKINRTLPLPKQLITIVTVLIIFSIFLALIGGGAYLLINQISGFSNHVNNLMDSLPQTLDKLPDRGISRFLPQFYDAVITNIGKTSSVVVKLLMPTIKTLPRKLISIFFTAMSLYFFTNDAALVRRKKNQFLARLTFLDMEKLRGVTGHTIMKYLRAQLTLMIITFIINFIALMIIGIPYFPLIAFGIAIIDAIPMLGPALVYMPWILYIVISGKYRMALFLLITYLITTFTRQIIEPKIVSTKMGVHPLFTLSILYGSYTFYGAQGFIVGAILVMLAVISIKVYNETYTKIDNRSK